MSNEYVSMSVKRELSALQADKNQRKELNVKRLRSTEVFPLFANAEEQAAYYKRESLDDILIHMSSVLNMSDGLPMILVYDESAEFSHDFIELSVWAQAPESYAVVYTMTPVYEGLTVNRKESTFHHTAMDFGKNRLTAANFWVSRIDESTMLFWARGQGNPAMATRANDGLWTIESLAHVAYTTLSGDTRFINCESLLIETHARIAGAQSRLAKNVPAIDKSWDKEAGLHYGARGARESARRAK
jgi:hypothetical protein